MLAEASTDGSSLTLVGQVAGTATVTVAATNTGGTTEQTFALVVRDVPPAVADPLGASQRARR